MKFKLGDRYYARGYEYPCTYHAVDTETGKSCIIDIFVSGDLPDELIDENLKGRTIEAEYTHPFLSIAHAVKLLPKGEEK